MSLETFAGLAHLEISSIHHPTDFIDRALARRKLARRITLAVPFVAAPQILVESDMVSLLPRRLAEALTRFRPLRCPSDAASLAGDRDGDDMAALARQPAGASLAARNGRARERRARSGLRRSRPRTKPDTPVSPAA